jgi:hypothetical protein
MYLDIIQTLPEQRTVNGVLHLLRRLCRETEKRGYKKISMHARVSNGFSKFIQKVFPESRCLRRIQNWYDSGESFDYIETPTRLK